MPIVPYWVPYVTQTRPIVHIENVVASVSQGCKVHLEPVTRSMYEPEQFPRLIHRMLDPKSVMLAFVSEKLVCAGTESEVYRTVQRIHVTLEGKNLVPYGK